MHICYIDESGCLGAVKSATDQGPTPIFAIAGLFVHKDRVDTLTRNLLDLKRRHFPNNLADSAHAFDWMTAEIKGATIRNMMRDTGRNNRRHAIGYAIRSLRVLLDIEARFVARVYVKPIGLPFDGKAVYTASVQSIATHFQHFLEAESQMCQRNPSIFSRFGTSWVVHPRPRLHHNPARHVGLNTRTR